MRVLSASRIKCSGDGCGRRIDTDYVLYHVKTGRFYCGRPCLESIQPNQEGIIEVELLTRKQALEKLDS
jgi:hypothetical protein